MRLSTKRLSIPTLVGAFVLVQLGIGHESLAAKQVHQKPPAGYRAPAGEGMDPNIFVTLAQKVVGSVVNISSTTTLKNPFGSNMPDDVFRRFFEDFFGQNDIGRGHGGLDEGDEAGRSPSGKSPPPPSRMPKAVSLGTGFVIDSSGLILTNNHVVSDADDIKITFTESPDERPVEGKVVGRDPDMDVALIRAKSKHEVAPLALGDSDSVQVGEYVIAVGNPFGEGHSVTHGIVSAKGRAAPDFPLATYIQTDAPINPGNSGGPLINLRGEVVGINNAIEARAQGIGFAIPVNAVKQTLPQLKSKGKVERGYIGIVVEPMDPEIAKKLGAPESTHGPFVTSVTPGDPAARAGIKPYDVVLEINGKPVRSPADLVSDIIAIPVGTRAKLKVLRDGKESTVVVKVNRRPGTEEEVARLHEQKPKGAKPDSGMALETLTPEVAQELGMPARFKGVLVTGVEPGGAGDTAGIQRGDVIVEVDRKPVSTREGFNSLVKGKTTYLLRLRKATSPAEHQNAYAVLILDLREKG